jgi:hypothetical protein
VRKALKLFSPAWLLRHLLALGLIAFFVFMGRWQWTKGQSSHGTLQNLFYGIEWWIFTAFVLYLWGKMILEEFRPSPPAPVASPAGGTDLPQDGPAEPGTTPSATTSPVGSSAVAREGAPVVYAAVAVPASLAATAADDEDPEDEDLAAYNRYLETLRSRGSV